MELQILSFLPSQPLPGNQMVLFLKCSNNITKPKFNALAQHYRKNSSTRFSEHVRSPVLRCGLSPVLSLFYPMSRAHRTSRVCQLLGPRVQIRWLLFSRPLCTCLGLLVKMPFTMHRDPLMLGQPNCMLIQKTFFAHKCRAKMGFLRHQHLGSKQGS